MRRGREGEGHEVAVQNDLRTAQVVQQHLIAARAACELSALVAQQHGSGSAVAVLALQLPAVGERLHAVDLAAGGEILQRGEHDAHRLLLARLFLRRLMHPQSEQHQRRCGCQHDGADSDGHQQLDHGKAAVVSFHSLVPPFSAVKWVMV